MRTYKMPNRTNKSVKTDIAGTDFIIGSLTLKCITIAPIIKTLKIIYE